MIVFCVGNGESRKDIDLNKLSKYGYISGCNAIYRDFSPDLLVAVNQGMIKEIKDSNYKGQFAYMENMVDSKGKLEKVIIIDNYEETFIGYVSEGPHTIDIKYPIFFGEVPGWSSGSISILVSIDLLKREKIDSIYLVGYDFFSDTRTVNNVYKNTPNYLGKNKPSISPNNWIDEIKQIVTKNSGIEFYRVGREFDTIDGWEDISNMSLISFGDMWKKVEK